MSAQNNNALPADFYADPLETAGRHLDGSMARSIDSSVRPVALEQVKQLDLSDIAVPIGNMATAESFEIQAVAEEK